MPTRNIAVIFIAAALAIPVNAAQAGPLLDRIKNTVKNEAKFGNLVVKNELHNSKIIAWTA